MIDMKNIWLKFIYQTEKEIMDTRVMTGRDLIKLVERKNRFERALANCEGSK